MTTGRCLCGAVQWRIEPPFGGMTHCHCSMCRKAHGAPFATYIAVGRDNFETISGEAATALYESSPGTFRAFCRECGSVVPWLGGGEWIYSPAGGLDDDPGIRPTAHIFATSKAPWHVIADELPQYDAYTPEGGGPVIERTTPDAGNSDALRGSCLCGAVAYEVTTPIRVAYNCHCSRCRRARAAAHTTNGFTSAGGLIYRRGEDRLRRFKLPEARVFAQTFCTVCGAPMPRANPALDTATIPFGSLDDDPGQGAERHIYVAYKAPWYDIKDDLPQSEEGPPR